MGGRAYALVTAGLAYQDEIDSLRISALQDRANTVHALDVMLAALRGLRDDINGGDEDGIADRLEQALEGRNRWLRERLLADWGPAEDSKALDAPSFAERFFGSAFYKRSTEE